MAVNATGNGPARCPIMANRLGSLFRPFEREELPGVLGDQFNPQRLRRMREHRIAAIGDGLEHLGGSPHLELR